MSGPGAWIREPARLPLLFLGAGIEWMRCLVLAPLEAMGAAVPPVSAARSPISRKEMLEMRDQDLGGDDVKLVRYKILFVKREYEAVLHEDETLVTYDTRGGDFGGLRIGDFMEQAARDEIKRPKAWPDGYPPPPKKPIPGWKIPEEDHKHVRFYFEVLDRFPREKAEYDREQVRVLRDISEKIG